MFFPLEYVDIIGIEILNSQGDALWLEECQHITVNSMYLHDIQYQCMYITGSHMEIYENEAHDCVLSNAGSTAESGWPQVFGTDVLDADLVTLSSDIVFHDNLVHDSWGTCSLFYIG